MVLQIQMNQPFHQTPNISTWYKAKELIIKEMKIVATALTN